jgi:hypothetical protein
LTAEHEQLEGGAAGVLVVVAANIEPVTRPEYNELTAADRPPGATDASGTRQDIDECVEGGFPGQLQLRPRVRLSRAAA